MSRNAPDDLKYTETDEWVRIEGDSARAGITDYAQDQLSDIIYVEGPLVGDSLDKGASFGTVESVKVAADLNMPVGGEIMAVNEALEDKPELVNSDPYGEAWMIEFKVVDATGLDDLMDASAYAQYCEEREH